MFGLALAAVLAVGQFDDVLDKSAEKPKPFPPSPEMMARVKEAIGQAGMWAFYSGIHYQGRDFRQKNPTSTYVKRACTYAAYMQIAIAYNVSMTELFAIQKMRSSALPRFTREAGLGVAPSSGTIQFATEPWRELGHFTRFDPAKVILPERIAALIGHKNPVIQESDRFEPVTGVRWKFPRIDPDPAPLERRRYVTETGLWPTTYDGIPRAPKKRR